MRHDAQGMEQRDTAGSKIRCGRTGEAAGQFQHEIRAAQKRHARAKPLVMAGERAALRERTAHQAEHEVRTALFPGESQMACVTVMEGVIFTADGADAHGETLLSEKRHGTWKNRAKSCRKAG